MARSIILASLFALFISTPYEFAHGALAKDFKEFQVKEPVFTAEEIAYLNQFHYVWVGGFGNELVSGYFMENLKAMKDIGIEDISRLSPKSMYGVNLNAEIIIEQNLPNLISEGHRKPLVIFAHSKAGAELVRAMIIKPGLILDGTVDRLVTVQSPLRGSHMGDQARALLGMMSSWMDGLHSMSSEEIDKSIRQALNAMDPETRNRISQKIFYVVSEQDPRQLPSAYAALGKMMRKDLNRRNDGVVAREHMWIPGFGTVLGKLPASHTQLVFPVKGLIRDGTLEDRRAFTYGLLHNIWTTPQDLTPASGNIRSLGDPQLLSRLRICVSLLKR